MEMSIQKAGKIPCRRKFGGIPRPEINDRGVALDMALVRRLQIWIKVHAPNDLYDTELTKVENQILWFS